MPHITQPEEFFDAPLDGPGHKSKWFVYFAYGVALVVFKICFRYRVEGYDYLKDLPEGKGAVLAGNHTCLADPIFVGIATHRNTRFIGKEELFENPFTAQVLARIGGFPVKRGTADRQCIRRAVAALKRGEHIGIFPEGTRVKDHSEPVELYAGAAVIAQMAGAQIVPFGLSGTDAIKPPGSHFLHFPTVYLRFGKPIDISAYADVPKKERPRFITSDVMRQVYELRDKTYNPETSPYSGNVQNNDIQNIQDKVQENTSTE